ncbi:hypothetical protein ACHAWT_002802 [Skeletonema menzelii]
MEPETQSEAPGRSLASSSFMDTKSEPPGYVLAGQELKRRKHIAQYAPAMSIKTPLSSSPSVVSTQRSVVTASSKNSLKLDRKISQASRISGGSRQSKQKSRSVASSSKKKEESVSSKANSQRSYRSSRSKSSSPSTPSSKIPSMQLALVPKSNCTDPPTKVEYSTTESAVISLYSSSISSSEELTDKGTQLDTIESETESESEEDTYTKESVFTPKVGQELVVRKESETTDSDEYALVEYDESIRQHDKEDEGVIVPAKSKYLAAAVDNDGAMVPLNSDVYEAYDHTFVSCPEHLRFRLLYTFLKKNRDKKIIIFYSTTDEVLFHSKLLSRFKIPVCTMHSLQERDRFINTFLKFSDSEEGVLCTTDKSGRDLDIPPSVDYVLQFDAPDDPSEYIMRIGRISCNEDRVGRSILFLNPGETGFLKYYDAAAIPVIEFEIPRLADIQSSVESRVNKDERMLQLAKNAYGSYLLAYASHGFRDVYNVHDLNKDDVAAAFGLVSIPAGDDDDDDTYYAGQNARSSHSGRKKSSKQDWMRGKKKMWPHSRVKVHPSFNKKTQDCNETRSQSESESLDE